MWLCHFAHPPRGAEPAPSERLRAREWLARAIRPASRMADDVGRRPGGGHQRQVAAAASAVAHLPPPARAAVRARSVHGRARRPGWQRARASRLRVRGPPQGLRTTAQRRATPRASAAAPPAADAGARALRCPSQFQPRWASPAPARLPACSARPPPGLRSRPARRPGPSPPARCRAPAPAANRARTCCARPTTGRGAATSAAPGRPAPRQDR